MCDCNLTLVGVISLAPAGDFDFSGRDAGEGRLQTESSSPPANTWEISPADWPTLRANNSRTAFSAAEIPDKAELRWTCQPPGNSAATAPTAVAGTVFVGSRDGAVRALDAATGEVRWTAYTGGAIYYPPTLWQGRALVGSGDGSVYCLDASNGRRLWRFRAAPAERVIPVYGALTSTWPVASGVLVADGVAYAAAGIAHHDGTHVFALDAETGQPRWHNHTSGSLDPETGSGVSVNGHLLRDGPHLYLAGGNMVPVAQYNLSDGQCTTQPHAPNSHTQFTAGSDLFLVGDQVRAGGPPLRSADGDYRLVEQAVLPTAAGYLAIDYGPHDSRLALFGPAPDPTEPTSPPARRGSAAGDSVGGDTPASVPSPQAPLLRSTPQSRRQAAIPPTWQASPLDRIRGIATTAQAVALVGTKIPTRAGQRPTDHLVVLAMKDGAVMWNHALPAPPVPWGLLVNRDGRIVVCLQDGRVACFGSSRP
jgi:outer membrane protein assembly factor BamB